MPAKPTFTPEQQEVILAAARRVYQKKFAWMRKTKDHPGGQEAMGLALGISQQTVSSLLSGKYPPGWRVARNIANLDGQTLEQLLGHLDGEIPAEPESTPTAMTEASRSSFKNLRRCVDFYETTKQWHPWTIAAAGAGIFGEKDFEPPVWADKLDDLEKALEKVRKGARQ